MSMKRYLIPLALLLAAGAAAPALACSPMYDPRSMVEKAAALPDLFVGKVVEVGADFVVLQVLSSRDPSRIGTELRKPHEAYGTCGELRFGIGETWLYDTDMPLSLSRKLTPEELGDDNGKDMDALLARLDKGANTPQE